MKNLQNKHFKFIIILLFVIIGYLIIGFIKYDFNPNNWTEKERASIFMFGILGWIFNFMFVKNGKNS